MDERRANAMPFAMAAFLAHNDVYKSFYLTGVPADVSDFIVTLTEFRSCLVTAIH